MKSQHNNHKILFWLLAFIPEIAENAEFEILKNYQKNSIVARKLCEIFIFLFLNQFED